MEDEQVSRLQAFLRGHIQRKRYREGILSTINEHFSTFYNASTERKFVSNKEFLRVVFPFLRIVSFPQHLQEFSLICRYMVASVGCNERDSNLALIFLNKDLLSSANRLIVIMMGQIPLALESIKGGKVSEVKCWQAMVHWMIVFSSSSSWSLVKGNAPIQQILNNLCSKMVAPLSEPENYIRLADSLFLAVNESRPLISNETLNALFSIVYKPIKTATSNDQLMSIFVFKILTAPGLLNHLSKASLDLVAQSNQLCTVLEVIRREESSVRSLNPIRALNLIGNLCHLGHMNYLLLVEDLLDWTWTLNSLMGICSSAIVGKLEKCSRTHWHPVFGNYKVRLDSGSESSLCHVTKQLHYLWGRHLTNCLFGKVLPSVDPSSDSKSFKTEATEIGHSIQKLWKKLGGMSLSESSAVSLNEPLSMTTLVCQLYMNALNTFTNLKSDILSGLCREDALLGQLWSYLRQWGGTSSLSGGNGPLATALSFFASDPRTPHLNPLHLFCDATALTISILDEEEMYEKGTPFSQPQLAAIARLTNLFCFRAVWNGLLINKNGLPLFESVHNLNTLLYARDSRRSFTNDSKFWIAPDAKSSTLISEFERKTERGIFLMRRMSHLISLKERMVLFRKIVLLDKGSRSQPATLVTVCRSRLVEDGYRQLSMLSPNALRHTIRVKFVNQQGLDEAGIDQDGVFKEFLELTLKQVFDPALNLFKSSSTGHLYPSSTSSINEEHLALFTFVGRLLAKAVYEGIVVDVQLAPVLLATVLGSGHLSSFDELANFDPELYKNLTYVKRYTDSADVSDLALTFSIDEDFLGKVNTVDLVPGGRALPVTNENKISYIHKMAKYRVYTQTRHQQKAFVDGFQSVLNPEWLFLFAPHELQHLISGTTTDIDLQDLRKHVQYYGGFHSNHRLIKWLWQILESDFSAEERRLFLKFVTSCSRGPLLGFAYLEPPFSIRCVEVSDDLDQGDTLASVVRGFLAIKRKEAPSRLPTASTCFNLLKLPNYSKKSTLLQKLRYAIHSETGFELS